MVRDQVALVVWRLERFLDRRVNIHEPTPVTMRLYVEALRPSVCKACIPQPARYKDLS